MNREEAQDLHLQALGTGQAASLVRHPDDSYSIRIWADEANPATDPPAQEVRAAAEYTAPKGAKKSADAEAAPATDDKA